MREKTIYCLVLGDILRGAVGGGGPRRWLLPYRGGALQEAMAKDAVVEYGVEHALVEEKGAFMLYYERAVLTPYRMVTGSSGT